MGTKANPSVSTLINGRKRVPGNKLSQKYNADSGVQVITPVDARQNLLLAKDSDQHL